MQPARALGTPGDAALVCPAELPLRLAHASHLASAASVHPPTNVKNRP